MIIYSLVKCRRIYQGCLTRDFMIAKALSTLIPISIRVSVLKRHRDHELPEIKLMEGVVENKLACLTVLYITSAPVAWA